jgi:hypothetical protein
VLERIVYTERERSVKKEGGRGVEVGAPGGGGELWRAGHSPFLRVPAVPMPAWLTLIQRWADYTDWKRPGTPEEEMDHP